MHMVKQCVGEHAVVTVNMFSVRHNGRNRQSPSLGTSVASSLYESSTLLNRL